MSPIRTPARRLDALVAGRVLGGRMDSGIAAYRGHHQLERAPDLEPVAAGRLYEAHTEAAAFYLSELLGPKGQNSRRYLSRRGFAFVLDYPGWCVGYAPAGWSALTNQLRREGFTEAEILASGLGMSTSRHTVVDRFRDRLVFGVRNHDGDVVAFIGRAAPGAEDSSPKYLNSPGSPIYDKSTVLFGLAEQRPALESGAVPILVEGPLDALAVGLTSDMAGIATCGTALTPAQVQSLAELTQRRVVVAFDSDPAGHRASATAYGLLAERFQTIDSVRPVSGYDPASMLEQHGVAGLQTGLTRTVPLADMVVDDVLAAYSGRLDNAEARVCALHEVTGVVATLRPDDVARQVVRVAARLEFDHTTVTRELIEASQLSSTASSPAQLSTGRRAGVAERRCVCVDRAVTTARRSR